MTAVAVNILNRAESERDFQAKIVKIAKLHGWLVHAERPGLTEAGRWRTAVQGIIGWPDIVLVRDGIMIVAELKSQRGRLGPEQKTWLAALREVPNLIVAVWRPSDWDAIEHVLRTGRA